MITKIAKKEISLLDQPFLIQTVSIAKLLAETTNQLGQKIAVKRFFAKFLLSNGSYSFKN